MAVSAEDPFGNLDTSYSQDVTITVPGDSGFTTAVQAKNGVAAFVGLSLPGSAQAVALQVTASGLSGTSTAPIAVSQPLPTPTIIGESVVMLQKKNKKGKPVGKPAFGGFEIDYSTAMNPSTAGNATNYQVVSASTKRVKKKTETVYKPVGFTAAYQQANHVNSVILTIKRRSPVCEGRANHDHQRASGRRFGRRRGRPGGG